MSNEKLIYASAARRAILKADPSLAYVIDEVKGVDAVEVVRCKDCKHYESHRQKIYENCVRGGRLVPMKPDDFCSYGEKATQITDQTTDALMKMGENAHGEGD